MPTDFLVKRDYLKELVHLTKSKYSSGDKGDDVKRIQEWLYLWQLDLNYEVAVINPDGIWGDKTDQVVRAIQKEFSLPIDGVVDQDMFNQLIMPLRKAFSLESYDKKTLREKIVYFAFTHLQYKACEINQLNLGPWVRSYMGGHDGEAWYWCQGFVCTVLDQAFSSMSLNFTDYYPNTFVCEEFHQHALKKNLAYNYHDLIAKKERIEPADIVVLLNSSGRANHVLFVVEIIDTANKIFRCIEGNTNFGGSRNGTGVFLRMRQFSDNMVLIKLPKL